jgi:hypothetical protein
MGGIEVRFGSEIGAYIVYPNFHIWEMFGALPRTRYSGRCYDKQLVAIKLDLQRVRPHDPSK